MQKNIRLFPTILLLTFIFCCWEFLLAIHPSNTCTFSEITAMLIAKGGIAVPFSLWLKVGVFIITVLLLHLTWACFIWGITTYAAKQLQLKDNAKFNLGIILWLISVIWLLSINALLYPASLFSLLFFLFLPHIITQLICYLCGLILGIVVFLATLYLLQSSYHKQKLRVAVISILLAVPLTKLPLYSNTPTISTKQTTPNVFIIGIDDLRPRNLHYFGSKKILAPHLEQFLQSSTVFSDSVTTMARTFVAWSSILTGEYPAHNGVRENYQNTNPLPLNNSLANILHHNNYQTFFAMDDISFVNITKRFGFDQLITPSTKADNMLLTIINDFPICNLLINSTLGKYLFPYSYANRLAAITYDPDTFSAELNNALSTRQNKPVFFAVHFCLTHWPFTWKGNYTTRSEPQKILLAYDKAIQRADQQFNDFLQTLAKLHLLDNAIVVVLSDHGEAFGMPEDSILKETNFVNNKNTLKNYYATINADPLANKKLVGPVGHGTNVLSLTQNNNLLAFRFYGFKHNVKANITNTVSLVDIKPTILDLLNMPLGKTDGITLTPYLLGKPTNNASRMIFVESGLSPSAILATQINFINLMMQTRDLYAIDPKTGMLYVKPEALKTIIRAKERAVYYQDWILALYPDNNLLLPVLVNRKSGFWTIDLQSAFAKQAPVVNMLHGLKELYGKEILSKNLI